MSLNRRTFIKNAAVVSAGFALLSRCVQHPANETSKAIELIADPNGYFDLPPGFSYRIISTEGTRMTDGFLLPGRPDGMGAFDGGNGRVILIRNHENGPTPFRHGPFGKELELLHQLQMEQLYDAGQKIHPSLGGTTTLIYNENTQTIEAEFLSLAGTNRNCAGGITPWNSWLTCEEDVTRKGGNAEQDHGFVFEVPATLQPGLATPKPILEMGRFNHEAVAVDPKTSIVYLTEDRHDGLLYRFIPNTKGNLHNGGKLQALAVIDQDQLDTRNWKGKSVAMNEPLATRWIDMEDFLAPKDDLRDQGFAQGAARFARGEGMWFGDQEVYFACTNGGPRKLGQVFKYLPSPFEGTAEENKQPGTLSLFAESTDSSLLHHCDNLTVSPWGSVFLCEDNGSANHIRAINQNGELYTFACNQSSKSELAGAVFSPSGNTLFVNIQENGETLAITGPWNSLV